MSQIVAKFNPATSSTTQFTAPNSAANGALVFFNESNISLDLTFADGSQIYLPAWYHRHKCGATGSVNIVWDVHQVLSSLSPPISEIIVEAFAQGETFPADGPLVRQTNVGNTINTVGGTANALQNDGNVANTSIIESTVSGDSSSAFTLTNDAVMVLGNATNKGSLTTAGPASFASTIEISNSGSEARIIELNGADFRFDSPNGTQIARLANNGDVTAGASGGSGNLIGAHLQLPHGHKLTAISFFTGSAGNSGSSVAHNLGVTPDGVIVMEQSTGSDTGQWTYNSSTINSTNVTIFNSNATPRSFFAVAFKFN